VNTSENPFSAVAASAGGLVSRGFLGNWVYVFRVLGVACREEEKVLCFKNDQTKKELKVVNKLCKGVC
jgi:hypothetical protein